MTRQNYRIGNGYDIHRLVEGRELIIGGVKIGNNSVIGAGAVVVSDVPNNAVVAGNPAKVIKYKAE